MKKPQPEFKIYNHLAWKYYKDTAIENYQQKILEFAQKWAIAMEQKMVDNVLTATIANKTKFSKKVLLPEYTLSGTEYRIATQVLGEVWWYGSQLKSLYNEII